MAKTPTNTVKIKYNFFDNDIAIKVNNKLIKIKPYHLYLIESKVNSARAKGLNCGWAEIDT